MKRQEGHLAFSALQQGAYAIRKRAQPLQAGDRIEIMVGGVWIAGQVDHGFVYAALDLGATKPGTMQGYYFISDAGERCGLCVGMRVRLLTE